MGTEEYTSVQSVLINVIREIDFKNILMESMEKRKGLSVTNVISLQAGEEASRTIFGFFMEKAKEVFIRVNNVVIQPKYNPSTAII